VEMPRNSRRKPWCSQAPLITPGQVIIKKKRDGVDVLPVQPPTTPPRRFPESASEGTTMKAGRVGGRQDTRESTVSSLIISKMSL
jgi:hypothetical protein